MNIETVNELIQSLESAGELSIKETKVMALAKAYQQLAAENVALKSAVTQQIELRSEIKKAGRPPHADFWIQSICEAEDKVNLALKETPATDRIVAGIKADGVEEFAAKLRIPGDDQFFDALAKGVALAADDFAKQLREGADK
ncbi:hypothetical protein [Klebsiella pneumoniae]|uniref:hypothetical protein n=1 Tax=Klebsiella pneumoniae TaxID=573 RepID=UPI0009B97FB7|nr:hypothetical protein [Klebsiella pneumoniae]SLX14547.1 Uncharacterised protein [Klebsiella pneumoniae]SLZ70370.1 Uncharacterised protein [Klebsiella pneumoniae]